MKSVGSFALVGAVGVVCVLAACSTGGKESATAFAVPVEAAEAKLVNVDEYSEYLATLRSRRSVEIRPQIEGYVSRILVKPGDAVVEGAPLVQVDPRRQQAAANSASAYAGIAAAEVERGKATLAQLEALRGGRAATLKLAEEEHRRTLELRKTNAIAKQVEDQSEATLAGARAELAAVERQIAGQHAGISSAEKSLQQTQASVQAQNVELQYYRITAPFSGVVGDVPVKVGDLVTPGTLVTTVDDVATALEAYVSVPVEDSPRLRVGLVARVLDSSQAVASEGAVSFVSPRIDPTTQSILAKVELKDPVRDLRAQQFLRARVVWASGPGLRIPMASIARFSGQTFLYVIKKGEPLTVTQVPVKLGEVQGNDVVVKDGLKAGERYVVAGIQKLRNGAPVTLEKL